MAESLYGETQNKPRRPRSVGCIVATFGVSLALVLSCMYWPYLLDVLTWEPGRYETEYGYAVPFDRSLWLANPDDRVLMARDIVTSRRLDGLTRDELEDMLGSPDAEATENTWDDATLWYSGWETMDPVFIHVWFDEDDRVRRYEYQQH